jgi:hypothetical protein
MHAYRKPLVVLKIVREAVCDTTLEKINQEQRSKDEKSTNGREAKTKNQPMTMKKSWREMRMPLP